MCKECFSGYMKNRLVDKKDEINSKRKERYSENSEMLRERSRISYLKNREKRLEYVKRYSSMPENKARRRETMKEWERKKHETDILFSVKYRISSLFRMAIRNRGYGKNTVVADTLGCTWGEFMSHIERLFKPGMNWSNRSEWHMDHIIPLATAKSYQDVIRLNHFTNIQPLWAIDNMKKGSSLNYSYLGTR